MTEGAVGTVGPERPVAFAARKNTARTLLPAALLGLALVYPLLVTQLLSGEFLHPADLDAQINVEAASSNMANQVFWLLLFAACVAVAGMRRTPLLAHAAALWPLFLYLAWSAATLPSAVDHHISMRRLILQFCIVGSIWLPVAMLGSVTWVRRLVLYMLLGVILLNAAAAVAIPRTSLGYAGFFGQKNALGAVTALGLVTFAMTFLGKSKMDRVAALIGIPVAGFLLVYSRSKTSFILGLGIPLLVYGICFASRALRVRPGWIVGSGVVFAVLLCSIAVGSGYGYQDALKLFFHDATFTGRTEIWSFAWSNIMTKPLAGFGFNGFWGVGGGSAATTADNAFLANILQSHNGYLDILLDEGFVGLGILVCLIVVTLGHCSRLIRSNLAGGAFCLAVVLFFTLHNFEESSAFRRFEPTWVLFLVAAATVARPARQTRAIAIRQLELARAC